MKIVYTARWRLFVTPDYLAHKLVVNIECIEIIQTFKMFIYSRVQNSIENFVFSTYRISSYSCRGNYSFLNSSSEETIQGIETIQGRKLYEEIR